MVFCVDPVHPTIRWEFRLNNQRFLTLRPYSTDGNVPNWFRIASIVDGGRPFDHLHPDYNPRTIEQLLLEILTMLLRTTLTKSSCRIKTNYLSDFSHRKPFVVCCHLSVITTSAELPTSLEGDKGYCEICTEKKLHKKHGNKIFRQEINLFSE